MKPAIPLAIFVLLASGCEQANKTEPARDQPAHPAPADTTAAAPAPRETSAHPIATYEIEELRKQGLSDPIVQIVEDLRNHPEVIPHSGALGSKMGFYDPDGIRVLSSHWVYARFEDGHIGGSGVFEFAVRPGGKLSWSVVSSRLEQ